MCGKRDNNPEHQETSPLRQVKWTLISAVPYPVTGETINIGIVCKDADGQRKLLKGPYRNRLKAFAPEPAIHRAIDSEIESIERSLEESGTFDESRHIVKSEKTTLVHHSNGSWVTKLLEQMVPGKSRGHQ